MEVANVRLRLEKIGSDVPVNEVTPAEAMFLHILHNDRNGGLSFGDEFQHIKVIGSAKVVVTPAVPEEREPDVLTPELPAVGNPGSKGYRPAQPAIRTQGKIITPAQDAVLRDRTDEEELDRLAMKYNTARDKSNEPLINKVWPDPNNVKLPQTFKELQWDKIVQRANRVGAIQVKLNYATGAIATTALPS
jgi:hypothetical protein